MKKWYVNAYRRHLLDMHIEDWNDEFLSKFDEKEYFANLKRAKIQGAMIYLQSHVGLCNFPTRVCKQHNAFVGRENKIKNLINLCHENGISVVAYYSLIYNNWAEINHPEWRMIEPNGKTSRENGGRYGLVCPNNIEYRKFVVEQIKELKEFSDYEGVFYDMPFWPVACRCDACKARWAKEVGGDIPEYDPNSKIWKTYMKKLQTWMVDFVKFVVDETKKVMPEVSIEFNNAGIVAFPWTAGSSEGISDLADYAGGDLYGDLFSHSFTCKYYYEATPNQPFEYMNSRCNNLQEHTVSKSRELLTTEISITRAHHGATFIIDAINPNGKMDARVYEMIGEIFEKEIPMEEYNRGKLIADVGVFFDSKSLFSSAGYSFNNRDCAKGAVKALTKQHVPVTVISNGHLGALSRFKCVIAPALQDVENPEVERLINYVKEGGKLLIDGTSDPRLIEGLLGGKIDGFVGATFTYCAPVKEYENLLGGFNAEFPFPCQYKLPVLNGVENCEVLAKIKLPYTDPKDNFKFASIHSNPVGVATDYPAIVYKKVGKGAVIWSAGAIELDERKVYHEILVNLIQKLTEEEFTLRAKTSENVEVVVFKDSDTYFVNLVNLTAETCCEYLYEVSLKTEKKPSAICILPEKIPVNFEWKEGRVFLKGRMGTSQSLMIE